MNEPLAIESYVIMQMGIDLGVCITFLARFLTSQVTINCWCDYFCFGGTET